MRSWSDKNISCRPSLPGEPRGAGKLPGAGSQRLGCRYLLLISNPERTSLCCVRSPSSLYFPLPLTQALISLYLWTCYPRQLPGHVGASDICCKQSLPPLGLSLASHAELPKSCHLLSCQCRETSEKQLGLKAVGGSPGILCVVSWWSR